MGKNLERSGCGLPEVLLRHLFGETDVECENLSLVGISVSVLGFIRCLRCICVCVNGKSSPYTLHDGI